eukprot:9095490-Pyramimonas_sp.AAC.1
MPSPSLALLARMQLSAAAMGAVVTACMPEKGKAKSHPEQAPPDRGDLNRMLTSLRYRASDAAKEAQAKWNSLVNGE